MMAQFRKKPVLIEAEQWFPDAGLFKGVHWERDSRDDGEFLLPYVITVHEQRAYLAPGDWIIPEPVAGRYYPCKPDIFANTYDPVAKDDLTDEGDALKACPFCGCEARIEEGSQRFYVACASVDCFAALGEGWDRDAMPDHCFPDRADAITAWNTRTDPPVAMDDRIQSLIADNERLREDVQAIREALDWAANLDPVLVDRIREHALSHKDMSK